jgi:asparagine synthase (glutamine-hydrolysing)
MLPDTSFLSTGRARTASSSRPAVAPDAEGTVDWSVVAAGGPAALASVQGSFAFGVREPSGRTFLAVDRFGIETLCYRVVDGELHFATRADELVQPGHALDLQALYDYLYFHVIPSPRTIFQGVFRLPPGHCAAFENGVLDVRPYWVPSFRPESGVRLDVLRDEFRELLRLAVRRQLGAGPPACFLSGGTDSSTVAGMLREVTGEAPSTYSIGFEAEGYDETGYARLAAKHFATDHHEYYVTPADLLQGIPVAAASFDQPFGNSSVLPAWLCARSAKDDGVQRLLAGDGGDELFGGNSRYATQRVFGWYDQVPPALQRGLMEPALLGTPLGRLPLLRKGASYVRQARLPMPDRLQTYNLLGRLGPTDVLTPEFLAQVDGGSVLAQQRAVWTAADARTRLDRNLAFDWRYTLAENDLPKVRMATALAGIEVGYPLLDDELLGFSARLPTGYKLRGLKLRWFFKEALRGFLPDEIITKRKHGFGLPFGVWTLRHPGLHAFATDAVRALAARGVLRQPFVETLITERLPETPGYYGEMVWISMMLEHWLRRHAPDFHIAR